MRFTPESFFLHKNIPKIFDGPTWVYFPISAMYKQQEPPETDSELINEISSCLEFSYFLEKVELEDIL